MNTTQTATPTRISIGPDRVMDVRAVPCSVKPGLIVQTWLDLPVGDHFILLNSRDPAALLRQFSSEWPEGFHWEHLVQTEDEVRIKITKLKPAAQPAQEMGSCKS